jgi:hypothetical protein
MPPPSWLLPALAAAIGVFLPAYAARTRGRPYAIFAAVILLFSFPANLVLSARLAKLAGPWAPLVGWSFVALMLTSGLHFVSLVRARLRQRWVRWGVSVPGMAFIALGAMSTFFLLGLLPLRGALWLADAHAALAALRWLDLLPVAAVIASIATSLRPRREFVRVRLGGDGPDGFARMPHERRRRRLPPLEARPLRIVQITDPHIGPWQPVHRLERRIEELLAHDPDLVLLTGDFLTMESNGTPGALARALSPLKHAQGCCFATFGNHDHEAPDEVRAGLAANGVQLLVDAEAVVTTPLGPVQILGADFHREERKEKLAALLAGYPRREGALRLLLLHDPSHFHDLPPDDVDLVLSGHTHGGQIGLVSFGLDWTVLSRSRWPDHGLFGRGRSRLYVHRGTGFYGFPLRMGVPGESSLMELVVEGP